MKKLKATFVLTFALLAGAFSLSYAQESNSHQYGTLEGQRDREDEQYQETELTPTKSAASKSDSVFAKPVIKIKQAATEAPKPVKKVDDDAVSFNFLYYVIQRFKSSDIIED